MKIKSHEVEQFVVCPLKWNQQRKRMGTGGLLSKTLGQLDAERFPRVAGMFYRIGNLEGKLASHSPILHRATSWLL